MKFSGSVDEIPAAETDLAIVEVAAGQRRRTTVCGSSSVT